MKLTDLNNFSKLAIAFYGVLPARAAPASETAPVLSALAETIPVASAVVVAFPNMMSLKGEQSAPYLETGALLQPLLDNQRQSVIPAGTPIIVELFPAADGVTIESQSLVFGGKVVPIQANSSLISSTTVSGPDARAQAQQPAVNIGNVVGSALDAVSSSSFSLTGYRGHSIGNVSGQTQVSQVSADTPYILTLETAIPLDGQGTPLD